MILLLFRLGMDYHAGTGFAWGLRREWVYDCVGFLIGLAGLTDTPLVDDNWLMEFCAG